ncbi:helix-turn-helix domain-containing protein [Mycobacterium sp. URHB0044]|uniref:helix-turn-helix domain-containing protein n=1 Tax=Mycobacterium sp. URHB0044 TaxID=1380386 RepID=UPI00048BEC63|nr:helix-turn-helix transcriptional regulator [Mycobacterium sp. URHB0044]
MPAGPPALSGPAHTDLDALGRRIRTRRQQLGVSMVATAEAAGISRVTLHRIERGVPAVTMGAYMNVAAALGLRLAVCDGAVASQRDTGKDTPPRADQIRIGDYPQLRQIAWQLDADTEVTEAEALQLYERNWRHVDTAAMDPVEKEFVQRLADTLSRGRLVV